MSQQAVDILFDITVLLLLVFRILFYLAFYSCYCRSLCLSIKLSEELPLESSLSAEMSVGDIEDLSAAGSSRVAATRPVVSVSGKRKNPAVSDEDLSQSWRTVLGPPPPMGRSRVS